MTGWLKIGKSWKRRGTTIQKVPYKIILKEKTNLENIKSDATKREFSKQQDTEKVGEEKDNQEGHINFLNHTIILSPPPSEPQDKEQAPCQVNIIPLIDEYEVINSKDEVEKNNQYTQDPHEDDETNDALIRAFSPQNDQYMEEEIEQVTQKEGLSPKGLKHEKFRFKN